MVDVGEKNKRQKENKMAKYVIFMVVFLLFEGCTGENKGGETTSETTTERTQEVKEEKVADGGAREAALPKD